mmetsp:Transcript_14494/g.34950  ORF Transcript_14494/g.34950 Transcript_14494/m.34950 type:complete len:220 (-) Transcript_14494:451-1110(-)
MTENYTPQTFWFRSLAAFASLLCFFASSLNAFVIAAFSVRYLVRSISARSLYFVFSSSSSSLQRCPTVLARAVNATFPWDLRCALLGGFFSRRFFMRFWVKASMSFSVSSPLFSFSSLVGDSVSPSRDGSFLVLPPSFSPSPPPSSLLPASSAFCSSSFSFSMISRISEKKMLYADRGRLGALALAGLGIDRPSRSAAVTEALRFVALPPVHCLFPSSP